MARLKGDEVSMRYYIGTGLKPDAILVVEGEVPKEVLTVDLGVSYPKSFEIPKELGVNAELLWVVKGSDSLWPFDYNGYYKCDSLWLEGIGLFNLSFSVNERVVLSAIERENAALVVIHYIGSRYNDYVEIVPFELWSTNE
jgi:hypothetical protein